MFIALGNLLGIVFAGFGAFRSSVFLFLDRKKSPRAKIGGRIFLYVALAAGIIAMFFNWTRWWDFVVLGTSLVFIIGTYLPGIHLVRIGQLMYSSAMLVHQVYLVNTMGIIIEITAMTSVAVFYARLVSGKLQPQAPAGESSAQATEEADGRRKWHWPGFLKAFGSRRSRGKFL
ncbi:MAG: YgjV family protein [Spirochaetes bacterium]|nr:YgjV family protein [Spirochaetota bacterium]